MECFFYKIDSPLCPLERRSEKWVTKWRNGSLKAPLFDLAHGAEDGAGFGVEAAGKARADLVAADEVVGDDVFEALEEVNAVLSEFGGVSGLGAEDESDKGGMGEGEWAAVVVQLGGGERSKNVG